MRLENLWRTPLFSHDFSLVHFTLALAGYAHRGTILVRGDGFLPETGKSVRQNRGFFDEMGGFSTVSMGCGKVDVENERVMAQGVAEIVHRFSLGFPQKQEGGVEKNFLLAEAPLLPSPSPVAFPLEALEMSVCPVGTTPKA